MGNTSGNCQSREGLLNSAPCSVLISRGRGREAPRERARGLRILFGGGRIRARLGSLTIAPSAERTSNVAGHRSARRRAARRSRTPPTDHGGTEVPCGGLGADSRD